MNFVPMFNSLSKVVVPFIASTSRLHTASLKPCPFDLVVKSGLNSFVRTSKGMPIKGDHTRHVTTANEVMLFSFFEELFDLFLVSLPRRQLVNFSF